MNGRPAALAAPDPALKSRLRRMRLFATALLIVMAVVFVGTTWFASPTPYLGAIRAFAEAALVGGLADWFAVTALFRRPLGLPIPHTAIVPSRKNEIGRALARFIRDHFLVREAVERRLKRANLAARLAGWLDEGAAFLFEGGEHPVFLIYGYKRGSFWPFIPTGTEPERDNAAELRLKNELERELPIEPDLTRWLGLFGAPL